MSTSYKVSCDRCNALALNGLGCHETGCNGVLKFTDSKGIEFVSLTVWSLDVWGNSNDGFEVNDRSERAEKIFVRSDCNESDVLKALKEAGLLNKRSRFSSFSVEWHDDKHCDVDAAKTGEPIFQLEAS